MTTGDRISRRDFLKFGVAAAGAAVAGTRLGQPVLKPMAVAEWSIPGLNAGHA